MAYLRMNYIDKHGRNNESVYTHIERYLIEVDKKVATIHLTTYISEEAKDTKYLPIDQEAHRIEGADYDDAFGESSSITLSTTRNSDNLKIMYEKLNNTPKWGADGVEPIFEIIIKDVGKRLVDEEISRKIAITESLVEDEDFKVVKVLVVEAEPEAEPEAESEDGG